MKKIIASILLLSAIVTAALYSQCTSVLRYAEGWTTFYWDTHYISETLRHNGVGEIVKGFFLQFFILPDVGVAVVTATVTLVAAVFVVALRVFTRKKSWLWLALAGSLVVSVRLLSFISPVGLSALTLRCSDAGRQNLRYMEMSNMARVHDWDGIISMCDNSGHITNLITQNFLNMALAEKSILGERLFDEPCRDIRSIYIDQISNDDFACLLSDIYYSMGHVAQAQRYAFELNEKKNNMSPRLLMRLVQTNIIYGEYAVAEKYIGWLKKTLYYKEWADAQEKMLYNEDALRRNDEYGMKRSGIIADNRFSGIKGLDDDLLHIARQTHGTRQCSTTLQYLASLYILAGYEKHFVSLCDEFSDYKPWQQKYFSEYYRKFKSAAND